MASSGSGTLGGSEHLMPKQQKKAGNTRDSDDSAKNSLIDDDPMSTTVTTQSVTSMVASDLQVPDTDFECCTEDVKELPPCYSHKGTRTRINVCSSRPPSNEVTSANTTLSDDDYKHSDQQETEYLHKREDNELLLLPTLEAKRDEMGGIYLVDCNTKNTIEDPTIEPWQSDAPSLRATEPQSEAKVASKDTEGAYKNVAPSSPFNQKERILSSCTSTPWHHIEPKKPVPSKHFINHPWILPFAQYSTIDDHRLFHNLAEDNDQGGIGSHGPECQICYNGSVQCVFLPCGHARTCWSCGNHFLQQQPCPFCRQLVYLVFWIYF